ncbi:uncharacterized protein LOC141518862 isoform X2 [Macrotis lagotis]|uniref:uncharacterized protein LOC141518862 isoform X2 n=1 Tax=Macrotis lagotis TaxID=92651 RepID=UPI003D684A1F
MASTAQNSPRTFQEELPRQCHPDPEDSDLQRAEMQAGTYNDFPDPEPGDVIEIFRTGDYHWAIYVGDGYIVHVAPLDDSPEIGVSRRNALAIVKKELLQVVVGSDKYRVNNKYDDKYKVLPPREIVKRALEGVGKKVLCKVTGKNSQHLVNDLRYGLIRSEKVDPKPGDLIEISRGPFSHWAVYVGDGYIVHLVPQKDMGGPETVPATVRKDRLCEEVWSDNCRVNNKHDKKHKPRPPSEIVQRALNEVGKEVKYNLAKNNCEHFANDLRYGVRVSDQVRNVVKIVGTTVGTSAGISFSVVAGINFLSCVLRN